MTEDDARRWIEQTFGGVALERLAQFVELVREESKQQNLISTASFAAVWVRHIADSIQLLLHAPAECIHWVDIGTGAGFPGVVTALVTGCPTTLVEPRRKRAEFLQAAAAHLGAANVTVAQSRVETVRTTPATVITARAVAPIEDLLEATAHLADASTRYILPRGRSFAEEVENLDRRWHGMFHVEQSLTDPQSGILIAEQVRRR